MTNEDESYGKAVSVLYKLSLEANSYCYSSYTTAKEFKSSYARINDIKRWLVILLIVMNPMHC